MMWLSSFIFGLAAGSFLNVVIYRLKNGGSVVFGRSSCPHCKTILRWHDLVPVLSFLWLKGHCRHCSKKISWQYPIVEILSGLIWVFVWNSSLLNFFYYIFVFSALLVIAVYDFKWKIIPDKIIYPAIAVVLIYNIFNATTSPLPPLDKGGLGGFFNIHGYFLNSLFTASIAFLFFFAIYFFSSGRAMGLGDAKLAFLIGLFLSPSLAIAAIVLAFIIGAFCGIILIVLKKKSLKSQIAFGPFLAFGAIIVFILSDFILQIFNW